VKNKITLVTGGARSGKSRHALELADQYQHKAFLATAQAFDPEMEDRIQKHQAERQDRFLTLEEPRDLVAALGQLPSTVEVVLIDCLTVWMSNLMYFHPDAEENYPEVQAFLDLLKSPPCDLILVTNEVGMGIVPLNALSRKFRDEAGRLNQEAAKLADQVFFVVSGIPMSIKG